MGHFRYRTTNANSLSHTNTLNTSQNYFTEMHKYPNLKFEKVFRKISGSTRGIQYISKSDLQIIDSRTYKTLGNLENPKQI